MNITCDVSMAKHKPVRFLYHLQRQSRKYSPYEVLYGNCNKKCKECPCGMYPEDLTDRIEMNHIPKQILERGSAQASIISFKVRYGNGKWK